MGKGFQPQRLRSQRHISQIKPNLPTDVPDVRQPKFKPWVFKFNGRRYETISPWHVAIYAHDPFYHDGRVKLHVYRRGSKTGAAIYGIGNETVMWGDEAIDFFIRHFYITPVEGLKLTTIETEFIFGSIFFGLIVFIFWWKGW